MRPGKKQYAILAALLTGALATAGTAAAFASRGAQHAAAFASRGAQQQVSHTATTGQAPAKLTPLTFPSSSLPTISTIPATQASAFGILRRAQLPADVLPQDRWAQFSTGALSRLGFNPALMRMVTTGTGHVWLIPGNGWLCLDLAASSSATSLDGGGMECNTTRQALAGRMVTWTTSESGSQTIVEGLVPDGVPEVTLTAADGTTRAVPVTDNVYGVILPGQLATVQLGGPAAPIAFSAQR